LAILQIDSFAKSLAMSQQPQLQAAKQETTACTANINKRWRLSLYPLSIKML
jgi:hypothetical protein